MAVLANSVTPSAQQLIFVQPRVITVFDLLVLTGAAEALPEHSGSGLSAGLFAAQCCCVSSQPRCRRFAGRECLAGAASRGVAGKLYRASYADCAQQQVKPFRSATCADIAQLLRTGGSPAVPQLQVRGRRQRAQPAWRHNFWLPAAHAQRRDLPPLAVPVDESPRHSGFRQGLQFSVFERAHLQLCQYR